MTAHLANALVALGIAITLTLIAIPLAPTLKKRKNPKPEEK